MAPKKPGPNDKDKAAAVAKKIEDKTFGMKNKNKSKQVQQQIAMMKSTAGVGVDRAKEKAAMEKAQAAAMNAVLFQEAVSKKDIERKRLEKAAAAAAAVEKVKEPDKRDIYSDTRDAKQADTMEDWDDEKLKSVVGQKAGGQGVRCKTDIICKHFLEAVEKRTYGWFWECPNGGDKCQYRHALPEDYVLKRDKVLNMGGGDTGPKLEDEIEERRKALTTRTPVTFERLQEWLKNKKEAAAAKDSDELEAARAKYSKTGKVTGVSGKMLFSIDASLFVDDAAANDVHYEREESDDEGGEDGGSSSVGAAGSSVVARPPPTQPTPPLPTPPPVCSSCADGSTAAAGGVEYSTNYAAGGGKGGAEAVDVGAADLEGVDESLFLDDDLPDDVDLE